MSIADSDILAEGVRYRCPATITPTNTERGHLETLPQAATRVPEILGCQLQDGHPGQHFADGQDSGADEWWLIWDTTSRDMARLPPCPATGALILGQHGINMCFLPDNHHGRHTFHLLPAALNETR